MDYSVYFTVLLLKSKGNDKSTNEKQFWMKCIDALKFKLLKILKNYVNKAWIRYN